MGTITEIVVTDIRFPTSREAHGSDAVVRKTEKGKTILIIDQHAVK